MILFYIKNTINKCFSKNRLKIILIFLFLLRSSQVIQANEREVTLNDEQKNYIERKFLLKSDDYIASLNWNKIDIQKSDIFWRDLTLEEYQSFQALMKEFTIKNKTPVLNALNRSLVFDEKIIGPDISWIVPTGFAWSKRYLYDASIRGHNRRKKGEKLFAWNGGDAVGQFYYQPMHFEKGSFGFNLGIRSVYAGNTSDLGGRTDIGEGSSLGFRYDRSLSSNSGFAIGGEQILQFDGVSDTGRDFYIAISKGWWQKKTNNSFPLYVATAAIATGKMAEGNIKGLCSDFFGGDGTEVNHQRRLCWAPVFSLSKVYNSNFSTFFEYNSKFFLLGTSFAPFNEIPLRGTFAFQLSDHIDNYKINNIDNMKWVFRMSLGF